MKALGAEHQVSRILETRLADLDELLLELDIPEVSWITKPTIDFATQNSPPESELEGDSDIEPDVVFPGPATREGTAVSAGYIREDSVSAGYIRGDSMSSGYWRSDTPRVRTVSVEPQVPSDEMYAELLDQVIQFAQWSVYEHGTRPDGQYFDHVQTFGDYELHRSFHNNRIGAAGELLVRTLRCIHTIEHSVTDSIRYMRSCQV
jgi:hypothetical protein